ncbi:hypothetical protein P7K49_012992 [Saguinus oedipus]|uniref:JMY/WHAMM middle domain-containing protein n=1 Tax=Saguinus oedipus TaxID=9490 RepID=A0ABQ9VHK1_SAGOE|nr:hypothetical protein P7K49_012992 [Saguinus oedipus]
MESQQKVNFSHQFGITAGVLLEREYQEATGEFQASQLLIFNFIIFTLRYRKPQGVLQGHTKANTMVALMKVYQEEDERPLYSLHVEKAFVGPQQYSLLRNHPEVFPGKSLDEDDLGPRRVVALEKEAKEWTRRAEEAVISIQDITKHVCLARCRNNTEASVPKYKKQLPQLGMQKQMEQDGKRFGQAAWATATPRLEKLKLMLARETLQLMRAKELCLNHKRAEIQGKMEDLPEQEKNINVVDELEIQFYEIQLELYDVKFEILRNEEILLTTQLDSLKRLIKEKQDEVVYYDPCESPEELKVIDCVVGLQDNKNLEVKELRRQCQQLESKRGRICAKRASLRSKKIVFHLSKHSAGNKSFHKQPGNSHHRWWRRQYHWPAPELILLNALHYSPNADQCKENHQLRLQQAEESIRYSRQHHSIQMKRDKIKEEEQKNKEWINQERQKTLQRLRAFKDRR